MSSHKLKGYVAFILAFGVLATSTYAVNVIFNGLQGTDWANENNWSTGSVPGSADNAYIRNDLTAIVSSNVPTITKFIVGDNSQGTTGMMIVQENGSLIATDVCEVGRRTSSGGNGTLSVTGGSLSVSRLLVGVGTETINATGALSVSGGTLTTALDIMVGADSTYLGSGSFTVSGSAATISSMGSGNGLYIRETGTMRFELDETGVSTIGISNGYATFDNGSSVVIDGSAYTGSTITITLVEALGINDNGMDISYMGFSSDYSAIVSINGTTGDLVLDVTLIPETGATSLLLGVGSLTMLIIGLRKKKQG
jgi:hypothetical protein